MSVDVPDEISLALNALKDAEREADAKHTEALHARTAVIDAEEALKQTFVDLYERLPVSVKNKIRHVINTTKIP